MDATVTGLLCGSTQGPVGGLPLGQMLMLHRHLIELSLLLALRLMGPVSVVGPHSVLVYHMVAFDFFASRLLLIYLSHLRLRQHVLVLWDGPARIPLGGLRLSLVL